MSPETTDQPLFFTFTKALQAERDRLSKARQELTLFGGEYLGSFAHHFYYRFEIPEDVYLHSIGHVQCMFSQLQPVTVEGRIINVENQFLTVALPMDFGPMLPEIKCKWNHDEQFKPIIETLTSQSAPHPVATSLFEPTDVSNTFLAGFDPVFSPTTPQDQKEAVRKVLLNRVSFLWGPILSGKTHVLALIAANYVHAGKNVLFAANTNDRVDQTLLRAIELSQDLNLDFTGVATRVGLPLNFNSEQIAPLSLEHEVDAQKSEKKKVFQERVALLQAYWKTKIHQFLHEDFYSKLTEMRDRATENKKQLEKLTEDLAGLRETINRVQNASMLEKLKKGFSKEEISVAQKQIGEKQALQKRLQSIQQALTTELMRTESQAPIDSDELREYQAAVKRIGELGGVKKVSDAVEEFAHVDELALLQSKRFVATTVGTALSDQRLRRLKFDLVIVDDAETVQLPTLASLAFLATERMIVAGDPYQLGPECYTPSGPTAELLTQDIFLFVAKTDQLHQFIDWSRLHSQWSIFLSSHYATTPKLSLFVGSVLFDDKINVFASPKAKGNIYFIDTGNLRSTARQYAGKKRIMPHNEAQTKKTLELVKHALMQPNRTAGDVGVVLPFQGTTLHTKLQMRVNSIRNVEVGTPESFRGRRKKAIIFDTVMAGVDYTMRLIDDWKVGEHRIVRMFNSVFSCVEEDLYILVDMSHFTSVYKERLVTRLLMLLQAQADQPPASAETANRFDNLDWDARAKILDGGKTTRELVEPKAVAEKPPPKQDAELELRMKMFAKQQGAKAPQGSRNFERETYIGVQRVLGYKKDVNLLSQYIGGDLLFRNSLATETAAARLPLDACQNEEEFRKIMERWNLMIYEMSGAGKTDLSYFTKQTPEARVRWDINNLKAYYSSDVEAVIEEGKHKIATSVAKVFQECLGKSQPANPVEWSTAYLNFLSKMESYLAWISEQLRK